MVLRYLPIEEKATLLVNMVAFRPHSNNTKWANTFIYDGAQLIWLKNIRILGSHSVLVSFSYLGF